MPGNLYKRPRVKVYGDEECTEYLGTKIFADGKVQSKTNLNVPRGAIEAAMSALTVKSIIMFVGDMLDPFGAESPHGPTDDMIPTNLNN
jgi:hypothetical protein